MADFVPHYLLLFLLGFLLTLAGKCYVSTVIPIKRACSLTVALRNDRSDQRIERSSFVFFTENSLYTGYSENQENEILHAPTSSVQYNARVLAR